MDLLPELIPFLGFGLTYLHSDSTSNVSLLHWEAPPRAGGIPIHVHEHTEEGFYVLQGQLGLWLDGQEVMRDAGSYTVVAPGQHHSFWNPSDEPAAYLTPIAPPGFENYLRELALGLRQAKSADQSAALRARLSERYDITIVGSPPHG